MPLLPTLGAYRRAGADPPFGDPRRDHEAGMEGYYWRFTDAGREQVIMAMCGVCRSPAGRWALTALAAHPGGAVRTAILPAARGDRERLGVRAERAVMASANEIRFDLGPDAMLQAEVRDARPWLRGVLGGSGLAQLVPGLPQYWHPHLLGGRAYGEARLGGQRIELDGATAYAEKNWGPSFSERWWWGQADAFDAGDACVSFAGGPMRLAGVPMRPTALAIRLEDRLVALAPPSVRTVAAVDGDRWRVRARSARHSIELEGDDPAATAVTLPVPVPDRRDSEPRSRQVLAGRLRVVVRRRGRTVFRGESRLAGLERDREP